MMATGTTSPSDYAAAVVKEIGKRQPSAWFWTGATTSIVRWGDTFLPKTFWVSQTSRVI